MPDETPKPPPAAVLIRLAREAAGITIPQAARAAGISVARWSQIEAGRETRQGVVKAVRAKPGTLAHMARAVGVPPERLESEGERADAAEILREIQRGAEAPAGAPLQPVPDLPLSHAPGDVAAEVITLLLDEFPTREWWALFAATWRIPGDVTERLDLLRQALLRRVPQREPSPGPEARSNSGPASLTLLKDGNDPAKVQFVP